MSKAQLKISWLNLAILLIKVIVIMIVEPAEE